MEENKLFIVNNWLRKSDNDILNIVNNLNSANIPIDTVCFHAQQAIEKALKAVLVFFDQKIVKTHDLVRLLGDCILFIPELAGYEDQFESISDYAVESRYPDFSYEPTLEEAIAIYKISVEVLAYIKSKIGLPGL